MTEEAVAQVPAQTEQPVGTEHQVNDSAVTIANNPNIEVIPNAKHEWSWKEGVAGDGDMPDWFNAKKYKTIEDQARAQPEAEKKLGAFTGAPEKYEANINEDVAQFFSVDAEDETFKAFESYAKEKNISQETFSELLNMAGTWANSTLTVTPEMMEAHKQEELQKLGDSGPQMVEQITNWGKANLNESQNETFQSLGTTAESITLLKQLIDRGAPSQVPSNIAAAPSQSREDVRQMAADPRYTGVGGPSDEVYRAKVNKAYNDLAAAGRM